MPRVLVRIGRRRSAWDEQDPRVIASVEFKSRERDELDLRPSVYVVDDGRESPNIVRVVTEHIASFIKPPRASGVVATDVEGLVDAAVVHSRGETSFSFANNVHAELQLSDEAQLLALIAGLREALPMRLLPVGREELLLYVRARFDAKDAEWAAVLEPDVREWKKAISKSA